MKLPIAMIGIIAHGHGDSRAHGVTHEMAKQMPNNLSSTKMVVDHLKLGKLESNHFLYFLHKKKDLHF